MRTLSIPLRWLCLLLALCLPAPLRAAVQGPEEATATLSGSVADSTGALIPDAVVHLVPSSGPGPDLRRSTGHTGAFLLSVPPGKYILSVEAPGFAAYQKRTLLLTAGKPEHLAVRMLVASHHEEISVGADLDRSSLGDADAATSTTFEGNSLRLLSNDPATLQQQLQALAGGGPVRTFVDGFSGGRLPPKSSIRSIRISNNQYSASNAEYGASRIDIDTNPGSDRLHGSFVASGTDQPLDAFNPYSPVHPPFYELQQEGNLNGPLGKKLSFALDEQTDTLANSAVVNAADPGAPFVLLSSSLPAPQRTETFSLRLDRQFGANNVAYVRDEWSETHITNSGIVPLLLPQAAFSSNLLTNTLQLVDTQTLGAHAVNQTRFQYLRSRLRQDPNSVLPSVVVQGSFQSGGNPVQFLRDNRDAYEVSDRFDLDHGRHATRGGFRFRALRVGNTATAGFNGQYIFPDVASYLAGEPSQYSQTTGEPGAALLTNDWALYAEDDWKLRPNLTLSYGLRFESQTAVPDHFDPAPRIALAWAVRPGARKIPIVTLKLGYGVFYERFPVDQILTSVRQNGSRQLAFVAQNPTYNPEGPPPGISLTAGEPTLFQVDPALHSSYAQVSSFNASRTLGRGGVIGATLVYRHSTHGYLTRNSNAPLPGMDTPADPSSGVRPLGTAANVYQFASRGNGNTEALRVNYHLQLTSRLSGFGVYAALKDYDDSEGASHFTANPYDIRLDYGRDAQDHAQSFTGGLTAILPWSIQVTPFLVAHSGTPFDVTTGTDLNGDTIFNDRPAFATNAAEGSSVSTVYGAFNVAPTSAQRQIPRNYGTSPAFNWLQLQVGKDIHLGPRPAGAATSDGKPSAPADRPWVLNVGVQVNNVLNHNNPGVPVGAIGASQCTSVTCGCATVQPVTCPLVPSSYFGHSLSLASDFSPNTASNRTILLQSSFTW